MRGVLLPVGLVALGLASSASAQTAPMPNCDSAEHRVLDYLVGDWRVVETASGKDFLQNRAERIHNGCGTRENLRMRTGALGTATTFLQPVERLWHTFVHDSDGFYAHMTGLTDASGRQDLTGDIHFVTEGRRVRKARQVTMKDDLGRPRQIGYVLNEKDLNWRQVYDITFCPVDRKDPRHKPPC